MKIWITGGAGFLGRRLTSSLKRSGNHIVSLSRRKAIDADESIAIDGRQIFSVKVGNLLVTHQVLFARGKPADDDKSRMTLLRGAGGLPW